MSTLNKSRLSEATVNNALVRMMWKRNRRWLECIESEKTGVLLQEASKRPDIVVNHPGSLPVIIESEFEPARTVEEDARSRLGKILSLDGRRVEQVIALKFESNIAKTKQQHLDKALETTVFRYALLSVDGLVVSRWPEKGYIEGGIDDFVSFVEQTALSESIMAKGTEVLESCINEAANIVKRDNDPAVNTQENIANLLKQDEGEQTLRMAMAILANAVSFHNTISNLHKVIPLGNLANSWGRYSQVKISTEWQRIYTEINYWPIFYIAREILNSLRTTTASNVFSSLVKAAVELEGIGATSQHDLSGRMLQRLISDRKFLATFYTLPSSAALLAELAVSRLNVNWSSKDEITKLQIGDFACGTGALLNAAYSSVLARYRRTGGDDSKLHAPLIEHTLVGTDIMPAATHLTASILSSAHPAKPFLNTRIITLPYGKNKNAGGETIDLGALDLIKEENVFSLFETSQDRIKGGDDGDTENVSIHHKSFDVVIMNPPFTRTNNHEGDREGIPIPAFAGLGTSDEEQYAMARKLKKSSENKGGNAGLAANFIEVAHAKLKEGGVLALIIPFTFASGKAWARTREFLEKFYTDITVVSIANANAKGTAFSADTGMAEVQLIATRSQGENEMKPKVTYVNLTHRPESVVRAHYVSRLIDNIDSQKIDGSLSINESDFVGSFTRRNNGFGNSMGILDVDLIRSAKSIYQGGILLPRCIESIDIKLIEIGVLGDRGPGSRDINSPEVKRFGGGATRTV